ncbi:MAG: vitamin K epoxide reductase family protein [Aeriscardovia sp.]|nr:vitamin K epoxide reductase family protein [Aeriscardovia sp.]MBQ1357377.1 vitamin K epoxide reductase family protein [Aeriscardovia sp.]
MDWKGRWRQGATWLYSVMLASSILAEVVSFALSSDTLRIATNPGVDLGCDINAVVSCSTVAKSWQADFLNFGSFRLPNCFLGICFEAVFVTVAVLGISRAKLPKWFSFCSWLGNLAALVFSYWLFSQELYAIDAVCPWCLTLMFSTTIQFMAQSHAAVTVQGLPKGRLKKALEAYFRPSLDLFADAAWILVLLLLIFIRDGSRIF